VPDEIEFRTKPQIALAQIARAQIARAQIDRALSSGVRVSAWTFDEWYGRDGKFLDGLASRRQVFVGEVPTNFHGWGQKPTVLRTGAQKTGKRGRPQKYPRVARRRPSGEVRNLLRHAPLFREQSWQRYRIKDTDKGPQVGEVKWAVFWRKDEDGLPTRRHCLIVARNVLSGTVLIVAGKYFQSNRVPGEVNPVTGKGITLRWLLRGKRSQGGGQAPFSAGCGLRYKGRDGRKWCLTPNLPCQSSSTCEQLRCESPLAAGRSKVAFAKGSQNWAWTITKSAAGVACIDTFP